MLFGRTRGQDSGALASDMDELERRTDDARMQNGLRMRCENDEATADADDGDDGDDEDGGTRERRNQATKSLSSQTFSGSDHACPTPPVPSAPVRFQLLFFFCLAYEPEKPQGLFSNLPNNFCDFL